MSYIKLTFENDKSSAKLLLVQCVLAQLRLGKRGVMEEIKRVHDKAVSKWF